MSDAIRPQISVVIPVRNGLPWIGATLQSVLCQTLPGTDFEVIIVDDGSTDGTADYCSALLSAQPFASKVVRQSGSGVSSARNSGIKLANADWIKLLDGDDLLHPSILEEEVACARNAPPEVALVASPWRRFLECASDKKSFDQLARPEFSKWPTLTLLRGDGFVQLGACLISKSWYLRVNGFSTNRTHVEDVDFLLRLSDAGGKFVALKAPDARFFYRTRPDSVSMTGKEKILEGSIMNALAVEARAIKSGRMCDDLKDVLLDVYGQGLRYWFVQDRSRFDNLYSHVRTLEPHYIPKGPKMLSAISRALGYPQAERVATAFRRGKRMAQRMRAGLMGLAE